ncbi:MAG: GNAT family N-acetyltransferase [Syntrophomonadaceae bacterium]|jgi:hypothetical protein
MTNKEKYRQFCKDCTIPIFSQDWWMDAVCGEGNWDVLIVEENGKIVASLPYYMRKKYGLNFIQQPDLTFTNGIWIKYPPGQNTAKRLSYEKKVMNGIIHQIEALKFDHFSQCFSPYITNWLPFYWAGYQQTTRYTQRIEDISDPDRLWKGFLNENNVRNNIRKAEKKLAIRCDLGLDKLIEIKDMAFARQGLKSSYTYDFVSKVDAACVAHDARKMFFAEDAQGRIHAALYLVWDPDSAYYILGGQDPALRNSGANSLIIWEAIKFASTVTRVFDFEGSPVERIERFFRAFSPVQTPYYEITKMSRKMKLAHHSSQLIKAIANRPVMLGGETLKYSSGKA